MANSTSDQNSNNTSPDTSKKNESPPQKDNDPNKIKASEPGSNNSPDMELPTQSPLPALYSYCETIYSKFTNDKGEVNYSDLRRLRSDLLNAITFLENVHPLQLMAMNKSQKQAFWINAYNLCTLKLIVDNYPIQPKWYMILYPKNSIMQIDNPWTKQFFKIQGQEYNLEEIEQGMLLKQFIDPRICFTLSDATRGGAILRKEPYRAETLDQQLDDQVKNYLASSKGLQYDKDDTLSISNLFNKYKDIFLQSKYAEIKKFRHRKDDERTYINFIIQFVPEKEGKRIENNDPQIIYHKYDWELNEFSK